MKQWFILGLAALLVLALMVSVGSWYGAGMSRDAAAIAEAMAEIEEAQAAQEAAQAANTAAWGLAARSAMDGLLFLLVVVAVIGVVVLWVGTRMGYLTPRSTPHPQPFPHKGGKEQVRVEGGRRTYPRPLPAGRVRPYGRGEDAMLALMEGMSDQQLVRFLLLRDRVGEDVALRMVLGQGMQGAGLQAGLQAGQQVSQQAMLPPVQQVYEVVDDDDEWSW